MFTNQPIAVSGPGSYNDDHAESEKKGDTSHLKVSRGKKGVKNEEPAGDDTMVYTLAHDIKSPINQVEGLLLIAKRMNDNPELDGILQMALGANQKLSRKVNELLDMNIREKNNTEFDLKQLVEELWASIQVPSEAGKVEMIHQCHISEPIVADMIRLKSILQNLMENAVKYRKKDKDSHSIMISSNRMDNTLVVKVSDNGIGIHPDNREKIFSASFQADTSQNGHGMGLYLARRNALTIGGNLQVESTWGEGSTFTLTLPLGVKKA